MAPHSGSLAWRIPGMGEPGGLPSMGSHRVGQDWCDLAAVPSFVWSPLHSRWKEKEYQFLLSFTYCGAEIVNRDPPQSSYVPLSTRFSLFIPFDQGTCHGRILALWPAVEPGPWQSKCWVLTPGWPRSSLPFYSKLHSYVLKHWISMVSLSSNILFSQSHRHASECLKAVSRYIKGRESNTNSYFIILSYFYREFLMLNGN